MPRAPRRARPERITRSRRSGAGARKAALDAAVAARDAALAAFPDGRDVALSAARASLAAASEEQQKLATEVAALESTIAAEAARIEAAVSGTRAAAEQREDCGRVLRKQAQNNGDRTSMRRKLGRLEELRRQRDAQDLAGAENRLREATDRHAALPVPERMVTDAEVTAARNAEASAKADLERIVQRDPQDARSARAGRRRLSRANGCGTRSRHSIGRASRAGDRGGVRGLAAAAAADEGG